MAAATKRYSNTCIEAQRTTRLAPITAPSMRETWAAWLPALIDRGRT